MAPGTTKGRVKILDSENVVRKYKDFNITVEGEPPTPPVEPSITFESEYPLVTLEYGDDTGTINCTVVKNDDESIVLSSYPEQKVSLTFENNIITVTRLNNADGYISCYIMIVKDQEMLASGNFTVNLQGAPSINILTDTINISEGNDGTLIFNTQYTPIDSGLTVESSDQTVCTAGLFTQNPETHNLECPITYVGPGTATVTVSMIDNATQEIITSSTASVISL